MFDVQKQIHDWMELAKIVLLDVVCGVQQLLEQWPVCAIDSIYFIIDLIKSTLVLLRFGVPEGAKLANTQLCLNPALKLLELLSQGEGCSSSLYPPGSIIFTCHLFILFSVALTQECSESIILDLSNPVCLTNSSTICISNQFHDLVNRNIWIFQDTQRLSSPFLSFFAPSW